MSGFNATLPRRLAGQTAFASRCRISSVLRLLRGSCSDGGCACTAGTSSRRPVSEKESPRPDGELGDKERCPKCGLDPTVIVAFEPLEPVAAPPPDKRSRMPSHSTRKPPGVRPSKAELVAENEALRAELDTLRDQA